MVKDEEGPNVFDIRTLRPELDDLGLSNSLAQFFNLITKDYVPLIEEQKIEHQVKLLENYEVAARLRSFKKPRSMLRGDIYPDMITPLSDILAIPLTDIYNCSRTFNSWPASWKEEVMVIIPKCSNPTSYSDLRNLSCTPLFTKVLESFVLDDLKSELSVDKTQYGSTKKCGVDHYLIETWDYILNAIEDPGAACNLISIDFSKAFNSLDHTKCLQMFEKKGASVQSLGMLRSFLEKRYMKVRIDKMFSSPLPINGGSPQGTLLGNLIFIIATSDLDKGISYEERSLNTNSDNEDCDKSLLEHESLHVLDENNSESDPLVVKYVDDILGAEKLSTASGKCHYSTNTPTCSIYSKKSEHLINHVTESAAELGLKVNNKKTQMICINGNPNLKVSTFIIDQHNANERVVSSDCMKILGFFFDSRPTVDKHIYKMGRKFKKRLWFLRHLTKAIKSHQELVACYCCFLRPILEYCSYVYHPMLNKTLTAMIESFQYQALKVIFGYNVKKEDLLEKSGLSTLEERRGGLFKNFCLKIHSTPRFRSQWLKERQFVGHDLRNQMIIEENFARTERLFKSPLFSMRRLLNDILVT